MAQQEAAAKEARGRGTGQSNVLTVAAPMHLLLEQGSQADKDLVVALQDPHFVLHVVQACANGLLGGTKTVATGMVSNANNG